MLQLNLLARAQAFLLRRHGESAMQNIDISIRDDDVSVSFCISMTVICDLPLSHYNDTEPTFLISWYTCTTQVS